MDDDDDLFGEMMEAQLLQDEDLDHPSTATSPPLSLPSSLLSKPSSYFQPRPPHHLVGLTNSGATCIADGTLVNLADGTSIPVEKVQVGAEVLSYSAALAPGETEGLVVRQVDAVLDQGHRECVELLFSDKRTLVCTPDHRIRTADGRWVEAKALLVGADEVAVGVDYLYATALVEGDDEAHFAHPLTDQVPYGVHLHAKVLPLFRVQLVGRQCVGVRHVYDLSVPSPQGDISRSFVANGVVVHNCYLNSLLQALYLTPEFRAALYELDEGEIGVAAYEEEQRVKGRSEGAGKGSEGEGEDEGKAEVSEVDVQELVSMGFDETKVRRSLQRFPSLDQRDAAIDLILSLPDDPSPPATSPSTSTSPPPSTPSGRPYRRIPIAFRLFFSHLQLLDHASLSTTLITSAFGWTDQSIGVQHDIHELFTRLCEAMEGSLTGLHGSSLISSLFSGALRRTLTCEGCGSSRARHEDFYSLHLPIGGCRTIHSSLAKVFEREKLVLGCDQCKGKRSTSSSTLIERFPFLLTFALGRHEYDRAKGVRVKLGDDFAFPLVLDMQLYGDAVDDEQRQKKEMELLTLHTLDQDDRNGKRKPTEADDAMEYQLLPSRFDPHSPHLYDLFAVVIHAGSAHSGHYFAYIRDVLREVEEPREGGWWWKFNDSQVSSMVVDLIASQYGGKKESAYMLMYRHRTPSAPPPQGPTVPPSLAAAAAEYNAQLEVDRARYEEFKHAMRVMVWVEQAVVLKGDKVIEMEREGQVVPVKRKEEEAEAKENGKKGSKGKPQGKKGGKAAEEKSAKQQRKEEEEVKQEEQRRAAELVVAEAEEEKREEERKGKYTFVVDERLPVDAFYSQVRERLRWRDDDRGGELRLNRAERLEEEGEDEGRRLEGSLPFHGMLEREEERIPDDHLHLAPSSLRQSLADLGVRHGDVLLAWNGRSLHSLPFFTGIKRPKHLRFSVRWVRDDPTDVVELTCHLPAETVVQDVVDLVRRRIGDGDLHLFLLTKRALTPIDLSFTHVLLSDVDITNSSVLVLEVTPPSPTSPTPPTLAWAYFHAQSSRVKLIVQDRLSPLTSAPSPLSDLTLRLDKSLTLHQLKLLLLSSLPPPTPLPHLCRLRKMTGHNRLGPVLTPETLTLLEAELDDDDVMVRLEGGRLPREGEVDLMVSLEGLDGEAGGAGGGLDQVPVMCEGRWTVKQTKQAILDAAHDSRPERGFVLYRGDAAGVAKDKVLANEFVTLDRLQLHHGDSLFLHVGELPLQGKVTLDVFVYTPSLVAADVPSLSVLLHKRMDGEEVKEEERVEDDVRVATDPGLDGSSPASTLDLPTRSSLLSFLLTLPFSSAATLLDLKTAIHSLSALSSLPSPSHLRIRTLNKADELHSLLTDDSLPLKRQGIGTDRRLAVQILAAPEVNVLPSALLLRTMLALPQKGGPGVQLLPAGGVELLFSEAVHPQVKDLKRWAARQVGLEEETVVVVKWLSGERRWKVVREAVVGKGDGHGEELKRPPSAEPAHSRGKGAGSAQGKGAAVSSLLTAPHHFHQQGQHCTPRSCLTSTASMPRFLLHSPTIVRCVCDGCVADLIAVLPLYLFPAFAAALQSSVGVGLESAVEADCVGWPSPILRVADGGGVSAEERKDARKHRIREEVALTIDY